MSNQTVENDLLELCWFAQSMPNQIQTFDRSNPFGTLHLKIMTFPSHMLHNWYTTTTHTDIQDERWQVCLCWWGYLSDEPRSIGKHVIVDVCVFHLHGSVLVVAINYQSESYNKRKCFFAIHDVYLSIFTAGYTIYGSNWTRSSNAK